MPMTFAKTLSTKVCSKKRSTTLASNVRFFSRDGVHELTVGREGKGPYELSGSRHALLTGPGDTLVGSEYFVHDVAVHGVQARLEETADDCLVLFG